MKKSRLILALFTIAACSKPDGAADQTPASSSEASSVMPMGETAGFKTPESVRYDADLDVFFVSNINGNPSQADGNGYISIVRADSTTVVRTFVESGKATGGAKAVTLNAPKGMAITGDTLWVADITVMRAINKRTGASIMDVIVPNSTFLNDVAVGPDGAIYVTDTGIAFDATGNMTHPGTNRIFRIAAGKVTTAAEGDPLSNPNGIAYDAVGKRWLLAPFAGTDVQMMGDGTTAPAKFATGPGQYDGIEILGDGRVLVSSWADSAIHVISGGTMTKTITGVAAPADMGVDTKRNVIAVPLFNGNVVKFFMLH